MNEVPLSPKNPIAFSAIQPMGSVFSKSEYETIARNIITILSQYGNTWRTLSYEEYCQARFADRATEYDVRFEEKFFLAVLPYTKDEHSARLFSPCWGRV